MPKEVDTSIGPKFFTLEHFMVANKVVSQIINQNGSNYIVQINNNFTILEKYPGNMFVSLTSLTIEASKREIFEPSVFVLIQKLQFKIRRYIYASLWFVVVEEGGRRMWKG